jgi:hypothetical protein
MKAGWDWKLKTIEQNNPLWHDLWPDIIGDNANPLSTNAPTPSATPSAPVVPAYAGTQNELAKSSSHLDSRMRGNDDVKGKLL